MYIVYGKSKCPNCVKAVELLKLKGLDYDYVSLEEDLESLSRIKDLGFRSVPVIFFKEDVIGGFKDLENKLV